MMVIGIDPGIATTGYGFVKDYDDGSLELVDYGIITTSPKLKLVNRLIELFHQLNALMLLHHPQSGAVEKLFFQRNVKTAMNVGHARGVAILVLGQASIKVSEYTPLEIKQAVTGYGNADKKQIQEMVRVLLNLKKVPYPDDAADALAVAICHLHSYKMKGFVDQQYA